MTTRKVWNNSLAASLDMAKRIKKQAAQQRPSASRLPDLPQDDLPPGWVRRHSRSKVGAIYYAHPATNRSQVNHPGSSHPRQKSSSLKEPVDNDLFSIKLDSDEDLDGEERLSIDGESLSDGDLEAPAPQTEHEDEWHCDEEERDPEQEERRKKAEEERQKKAEEERQKQVELRKAQWEAKKRMAQEQERRHAEEEEAEEAMEKELKRKATIRMANKPKKEKKEKKKKKKKSSSSSEEEVTLEDIQKWKEMEERIEGTGKAAEVLKKEDEEAEKRRHQEGERKRDELSAEIARKAEELEKMNRQLREVQEQKRKMEEQEQKRKMEEQEQKRKMEESERHESKRRKKEDPDMRRRDQEFEARRDQEFEAWRKAAERAKEKRSGPPEDRPGTTPDTPMRGTCNHQVHDPNVAQKEEAMRMYKEFLARQELEETNRKKEEKAMADRKAEEVARQVAFTRQKEQEDRSRQRKRSRSGGEAMSSRSQRERSSSRQRRSRKKALEAKDAGNTAFQAQRFTEAIKHYSEAIRHDPTDAVFFSNRSGAYVSSCRFKEALTDAKECVRLKPEWWKGYSRKGTAEFKLGYLADSEVSFKKGLGLQPDEQSLKDGLAQIRLAAALRGKR